MPRVREECQSERKGGKERRIREELQERNEKVYALFCTKKTFAFPLL